MVDSVYITVKEAASHLRMHPNTVLNGIERGDIEAVTVGKGKACKKLIRRKPFEKKFGKVGAQ